MLAGDDLWGHPTWGADKRLAFAQCGPVRMSVVMSVQMVMTMGIYERWGMWTAKSDGGTDVDR